MKRILLLCAGFIVAVPVYTLAMARLDLVTPPEMAASHLQADLIHVDKSERVMALMRDGETIATYEISVGTAGDSGHKQREGDLSLHISYPNAADIAAAQLAGDDPGGFIMIHGIANGWGWVGNLHRKWDWTDGCIAVTNAEMREIWSLVPNGTPIEIEA